MKNKIWHLFGFIILLSACGLSARAQGTAFSYQGRLNDGAYPATGLYDVRFSVCDALTNGSTVAGPLTNTATGITNGLFSTVLDFGAGVFTGPARWLQLDVRTNGTGTFTPLAPRELLLAVPYAVMANSASNLLGTLPATQLSGTLPPTQLPSSVLTNNQSGLTLSGTFTGNGAGLTNVSGGVTWQNVTGTSQQAQPNTGYLANNAAQVTITLPASPNLGDIVRVSGVGAGGWQIVQNVGGSQTNQYLFTGSETNFTLNPGIYDLITYGAQGGNGGSSGSGGFGAKMEAQFFFPTSTTLTLLVGAVGGNGNAGGGGGGGGSFVVEGSAPLVIAGGGGGGNSFFGNGGSGVTNLGGGGGNGGNGGSGGSGGFLGSGSDGGGGGGGYLGNGGSGGSGGSYSGSGGSSFISGGNGGGGSFNYANGGYGGGGGGSFYGGGGGGGYSGGGGGCNAGGYGGGSIIDPSAIAIGTELAGVQSGSGEVDIFQILATKFAGDQNTAIELQYIGNGQWLPLSHEGPITAY